MERFLERIAFSKYRDCFIVKGGILVISMIGISLQFLLWVLILLLEILI